MKRILFICHGNICRSPMAEMIMKKLVADRGLTAEYVIESCATSAEELGNDVYPPARRELSRHGIPCPRRAARRLKAEDYARFDRLICMESYNLRNALRLLGGDPEHKLSLLLDDRDVADPWYSDDFETAYRDIEEGCGRLLDL
ncbi:MAG: low molecular weight phosphotyrosine protein phosphatase [Clostridia bacterium]|nr:low molecular weight phosphotyrosine protein phosphatase [Clostridia bacterium]